MRENQLPARKLPLTRLTFGIQRTKNLYLALKYAFPHLIRNMLFSNIIIFFSRPWATEVTWSIQSMAIDFLLHMLHKIWNQYKSVRIQEMMNNSVWKESKPFGNLLCKFAKITYFYQNLFISLLIFKTQEIFFSNFLFISQNFKAIFLSPWKCSYKVNRSFLLSFDTFTKFWARYIINKKSY